MDLGRRQIETYSLWPHVALQYTTRPIFLVRLVCKPLLVFADRLPRCTQGITSFCFSSSSLDF